MKKLNLTLLLAILLTTAFAQYSWVNKSDFSGPARFKAASFDINGKAYLVGGRTSTSPLTYIRDTWEYDPSNDSWTQKSNFPYAFVQPASFTLGGKGYIVGGQNSSLVYVNTTNEYDPTNDSWTAKAAFPESGVGGMFEFVVDGKAYVGAGARNSNAPSATVYQYNATNNTWTQKADYPGSLTVNPIGFSIDGYGYAGLGTYGNGTLYNEFYKYDAANDTWSAIAQFPGKPRFEAMAFVVDGKAYVGGGARVIAGTYFSLSDWYVYDPTADAWSPAPGLPGLPRAHGETFTINNRAFEVGGYDYDGDDYYKTVSEFVACDQIAGLSNVNGNTHREISVYPNPTTGALNVSIAGEALNELTFEVTNLAGQLVKSGNSRLNTFSFSTNSLSNGIYLLTIKDNTGNFTVKRFEVIK